MDFRRGSLYTLRNEAVKNRGKRGPVMPSFEEARRTILESVPMLGAERVDLLSALGRVATEDVAAPWDMPFYDNSAMDGFAVRAADCRTGGILRVTGYVPAGETGVSSLTPGCAVRIMTGAVILTLAQGVILTALIPLIVGLLLCVIAYKRFTALNQRKRGTGVDPSYARST